ncbi:MAG TPA: ECF transporter S component [Firmicutes bacterium]|nr:ECF transporter S component [Bacillota bacterium]
MHTKLRQDIYAMTLSAVCGAMGFLLMAYAQFPIVPAYSFLRFDPGEFAMLLAGVTMGPRAGVMAVAVKDLLYLLFRAKSPFGPIADFIACSSFVYVVSLITRQRKDTAGLAMACVIGTIARIIVMIPANVIILRLQFGFGFSKVMSMVWPVIVPFNVVKSLTNALIVIPLIAALKRTAIISVTLGRERGGH